MPPSSFPSVAVVTPTYNERDNVAVLIGRLRQAQPGVHVYVVDDSSPDGTGDAVAALAEAHGGLTLIRRPVKAGLASAYVAGFHQALSDGHDRIVQMDADLSHDPNDLPRLLESDADLTLGSRYVPGGGTRNWPLHRRVLSRGGSIYSRLWLGLPYRDLTGGFKVWRHDCLRAALQPAVRSEGYVFQVEMTLRAVRAGARIDELPIVFTERVGGVSKMSRNIALEAALAVPRLRFA
jgi:dolichol-phosphate mannosyltransferase